MTGSSYMQIEGMAQFNTASAKHTTGRMIRRNFKSYSDFHPLTISPNYAPHTGRKLALPLCGGRHVVIPPRRRSQTAMERDGDSSSVSIDAGTGPGSACMPKRGSRLRDHFSAPTCTVRVRESQTGSRRVKIWNTPTYYTILSGVLSGGIHGQIHSHNNLSRTTRR